MILRSIGNLLLCIGVLSVCIVVVTGAVTYHPLSSFCIHITVLTMVWVSLSCNLVLDFGTYGVNPGHIQAWPIVPFIFSNII